MKARGEKFCQKFCLVRSRSTSCCRGYKYEYEIKIIAWRVLFSFLCGMFIIIISSLLGELLTHYRVSPFSIHPWERSQVPPSYIYLNKNVMSSNRAQKKVTHIESLLLFNRKELPKLAAQSQRSYQPANKKLMTMVLVLPALEFLGHQHEQQKWLKILLFKIE